MHEPGEVINVTSCEIVLDGKVHLVDNRGGKLLLDDPGEPMAVAEEIRSEMKREHAYVVRIPGFSPAGVPLVRRKKYLLDLRNHFLTNSKRPIPVATDGTLKEWHKRWAEAAHGWRNVRCLPTGDSLAPLPSPLAWAQVVFSEHAGLPRWVMPGYQPATVFSSAPLVFAAQSHFSPQYYFSKEGRKSVRNNPARVPPCCYRPLAGTPQEHRALSTPVASDDRGREKRIHIVHHGFIHPETAHYKFKKHVVDNADEHPYWDTILKLDTTMRRSLAASLAPCNGADGHGTCHCPSLSTFNEVHARLKDKLDPFCDHHVTFLGQAKTIGMIAVCYGRALCYVNINAIGRPIRIDNRNYYPRLSAWGVCHDWDVESPTLHLFAKNITARQNKKLWGVDNIKFLENNPDAKTEEFRLSITSS